VLRCTRRHRIAVTVVTALRLYRHYRADHPRRFASFAVLYRSCHFYLFMRGTAVIGLFNPYTKLPYIILAGPSFPDLFVFSLFHCILDFRTSGYYIGYTTTVLLLLLLVIASHYVFFFSDFPQADVSNLTRVIASN